MKPDARFDFIAGAPAFCLVDTVRSRGGDEIERLNTPRDLSAWLRAAGLESMKPARATEQNLVAARVLRDAIYRCSLAAIDALPAAAPDVETLNRIAAKPPLRPQWAGGALVQVAASPVEAALSTLAADALQILGSASSRRIRICAGCQMMFLDTSRPGKRRWCSSVSGCGNRAKVRNLRARQSAGRPGNE